MDSLIDYKTLPFVDAIFTCAARLLGYYTWAQTRVMNSLFEVVFWGAPAVLLSWALLLALACGLVFRDDRSPREKPRRSEVAGA